MIPLIGSICKGSIGVSQLPRTWWKTVTRAVGLLDPAYPDRSAGLDTMCLEAIELDLDETYDYLRAELPDYVTFEDWILDKKGGKLPAARVARFNEVILYRRHSRPEKITETYTDIGFDPDVDTHTSALLLNTLQDWQLFHRDDYSSEDCDIPPGFPPLISSIEVGQLDVMQLSRTWCKVLLEAKGLLNSGYPACGGGLDQRVLDALGLDRNGTLAYIRENLPTYLDFEAWVISSIGEVDRAKVDGFQTVMLNREHAEPKRTEIHDLTGCDRTISSGALLNHLEDWRYAYDNAIVPRR